MASRLEKSAAGWPGCTSFSGATLAALVHFTPSWQVQDFDLNGNGQWKRSKKHLFVGKYEERPTQVNAQGLLREVHAAERLSSINTRPVYFLVRLA